MSEDGHDRTRIAGVERRLGEQRCVGCADAAHVAWPQARIGDHPVGTRCAHGSFQLVLQTPQVNQLYASVTQATWTGYLTTFAATRAWRLGDDGTTA